MTHHPHRSATPGPRRLLCQQRLRVRNAMLATERTKNITVELVRSQTRQNEADRALRTKGGLGDAAPLTTENRIQIYRRANRARGAIGADYAHFTTAQLRTLRRRATADEVVWQATDWTKSKDRPTPKRPKTQRRAW